MREGTGETTFAACEDGGPRDRGNRRRMVWTTVAWTVAFLGATLLIEEQVVLGGLLPWLVAAVPGLLGVAVVLAFARFLKETDELERLIQLQGLALGFGGGLLAIFGYGMFERLGAPALGVSGASVVLVMLYVVGVVVGRRRYR